ncbi:sensor histidine kinase [Agromyces aerolatus]|uniref:sensor histidine kinase n=1 Tax=Agromyces sp. LY-1074 TaxID=3074080 RepID=UPI0028652AD3|nr:MULTISPECIES: HAMP domain-containing sensor histidine kinase [unclassified Agromyces]MDR5699710.1 HAMP domain-containing sensor histidine kinase [Agromyces sp. LY-1074]MDR5706006.1 HAMP domain-containing sensor histidine kinase [Agromyces sp. LY-1358]
MHQTVFERWSRVSLRTKITGVTVLMLTLGLLVSGIGTAAMLRGYVDQQMKDKLQSIAQNGVDQYFESPSRGSMYLDRLDFSDQTEVFVAQYDAAGEYQRNNWEDRSRDELPKIPQTLPPTYVDAINDGHYAILELEDIHGQKTFRGIAILETSDAHGTFVPILIAISTKDTEQLLTAYLTIFLGFGFGVIVVGALLTRMLVTTTFAPLREVEQTAAAIADGDFSQRLGGATPNTEVGRLNRSLNTMLNRIDRAFRDRARTIEQMRRFVGDASHELRTPLVSVRGYAELYRMGALQTPEEVGQAMDRIEKEAIRMGGLVEDLLALARLDEAKPLVLAEVDLVPLARDAALDTMAANPGRVVTVIAPEERAADATGTAPILQVELEPGPVKTARGTTTVSSLAGATLARLRGRRVRGHKGVEEHGAAANGAAANGASAAAAPEGSRAPSTETETGPIAAKPVRRAIVLAEENKIRQIITNLMGNAVRFTAVDTPIEIRVSVDDEAERARIEVVDHGEGIPPQIREKIFQRFWRADTSRTRETGGSGLGLAIVSSIVAAHNGTVDVVETPGGGATFRVSLPLAGSAAAPQRVADA